MEKYRDCNLWLVFCLVIMGLGLSLAVGQVRAQGASSGIALLLPVASEAPDGSIVCSVSEGFDLCDQPYANNIFGLVTDDPVAAFESLDAQGGRYIVSSGRVRVRVNDDAGEIVAGDWVTTSGSPGVGAKATQNGYVVGSAMEDATYDANGSGTVEVILNIHLQSGLSNARSNLLEYLRQGIEAPLFEPLASLRYALAALLILISFALGFIYFGRMAKSGVEAIGRNPLASRMIQVQVAMNVAVLIIVVLAGLFAAYLVLIL